MRVSTDTTLLTAAAGGRAELTLDVVNTSEVIDGVTARVIGLDPEHVTTRPALLPLFPDSSGRLELTLALPPSFPAGRHPLTVEVSSSASAAQPRHVDVDLVVAPREQVEVRLRPALHRTHRRGRFTVEATNRGNVPLELTLSARDQDRALRCQFDPPTLTVAPGATGLSALTVRAPRKLFGNETDRTLTIAAEAGDTDDSAVATLRQRPYVVRGVLTTLVLVSIVGLWALAFLLGLSKVFGSDPLTKAAPASFFVSSASRDGLAAQSTPVGMLAKTGTLPAGVGGAISGTVTASSTGNGVGRVVVEALRPGRNGTMTMVSSAATQSDGSYVLIGLLPGDYLLRFSGHGLRTAWYPSADSASAASKVSATPEQLTKGIDTSIVGLPASISGSVDPGDTVKHPATVVTARPLEGSGSGRAVTKVTTDAQGHYKLTGLPAPDTYELTFTTPGYQPTSVVERVSGGQQRTEPTVMLSAGDGEISGVVTDGHTPLGGVQVTTTAGGQQLSTATPTLGTVGHFTLTGLKTPGTYVVTFTKDKYGAQTVVIDLGPGQHRSDVKVNLVGGTGTVSGRLVDAGGNGLGGATVTVGGTPDPVTTTTLTDGTVGAFALSGLPTPGSYTLTFTLDGFQPQTVPVTLDDTHASSTVQVTLSRGLGQITGRVLDPSGQPVVGAKVTVTDGKTPRSTVTTATGDPGTTGSYRLTGLAPGAYAVTVTLDGYGQQTALVHVTAGNTARQDLQLQPGGTS